MIPLESVTLGVLSFFLLIATMGFLIVVFRPRGGKH